MIHIEYKRQKKLPFIVVMVESIKSLNDPPTSIYFVSGTPKPSQKSRLHAHKAPPHHPIPSLKANGANLNRRLQEHSLKVPNMAEQHRVHPVDVESPPPSAPEAPPSLLQPEKAGATAPAAHSRPPRKRRSRCCTCLCWSLLAIVILIVVIAVAAGVLYLVFRPKIPKYSVDRLAVSSFAVDDNATVAVTFNVTVTARNPNRRIGIYYQGGSDLSAWYTDERLCTGSFPAFYQGHRNTTVLHVLLAGEAKIGNELLTELQQQQQTGTIPLAVRGVVPVRVKLGKLKLWKVRFKVRCSLVVNSLSANGDVSIRSSSCKFKLKL
ncbi:NDR1/HIN1-like protein 6 [Musa acuminata AAA Group]|uniref:NDR1/HIN1-like protein 6 n=1 Tax=Musa acuminata AAA Group TaxID=214697 RepID=UPI0031D542E1